MCNDDNSLGYDFEEAERERMNDQSGPVEPIKEGLPDEELERLLAEEAELARREEFQALQEASLLEMELLKQDRTSFGVMEIRHRFGYHKPGPVATEMHRAVRHLFSDLSVILDRMLPEERAKRMTFQKLEEACMWAQKAIAEMSPVVNE